MTEPLRIPGRKVALRHLVAADLPVLHQLALDPEVRASWRTRGDLWSFAQFEQHVAGDPQISLVATALHDQAPLALIELHDVDLLDARAQLAILVDPAAWASGVAAEAAVLFAGFAFGSMPIDKVACTVQATNRRAVPALRRILDHEGTLRRHLNVHGTWIDLEVFALWRDHLDAIEAAVGLGPRPAPCAPDVSLRGQLEAILHAAGFEPADLDHLTFGDLDSLAVVELVDAAEARLGRLLAIESLALDQPIADLLVIVGPDGPPPTAT